MVWFYALDFGALCLDCVLDWGVVWSKVEIHRRHLYRFLHKYLCIWEDWRNKMCSLLGCSAGY